MNNVLANIESQVSPAAIQEGHVDTLKVGHINHGAALYSTFVAEADKQGLTQMETIRNIALVSCLSHVEFAKAIKDAQETADTVDKANGFVKVDGSKGQDNYGPKRRLLNQRASEAKQLFGVFKLQPQLLQEKGYWQGLSDARDYLKALNIKWDNSPVLSDVAQMVKREKAANQAALADVMAANIMLDGELRSEYLERIDVLAEEALQAAKQEKFNEVVKSTIEKLTEKHGDSILLAIAEYAINSVMGEEDRLALRKALNEEFDVPA